MKTKLILLIGLFFIGFSMPSEAQILKKLGKKIEKKVNDRIDRKEREIDQKVDQKIDESMDQAEKGTQDSVLDWITGNDDETGNSNAGSTTAESPAVKDPRGENYTLKIEGSGPDFVLAYKMDMDMGTQEIPKEMGGFEMQLKLFASNRLKRSRSEVITKVPIIGEMRMTTLANFDDPSHIIMINDKKKTYAIMDVSDAKSDAEGEDLKIEVIGKEILHGLNTTHFKIFNGTEDFALEMWTSKDLPGYREMIDIYTKNGQMGDAKTWQKIVAADADGFLVRMQSQQESASIRLDLQNIEQAELSSSLFEIPSHYEKKKNIASTLF